MDNTSLGFRDVPRWLIYPLLYVSYALSRGLLTGWHAYPFIDVSQLGFARVLLNAAGLTVVFALSGALAVGVGRVVSYWRRDRESADAVE